MHHMDVYVEGGEGLALHTCVFLVFKEFSPACVLFSPCGIRLTLEQKELCRSRLKLLSYLDRLATYEVTTIKKTTFTDLVTSET